MSASVGIGRFANQAFAVIAILSLVVLGSFCGLGPRCPETVDQAISGDFSSITDRSFVAVGRVARFVDAAHPESRGYDLDVRRGLSGNPSAEGTFLRISDQLPGMAQGQAVLILAEPGPNKRVIVPGACAPLHTITDAELVRWTGSP